ncbi:hypothetical protein F9K97_18895 [Brucella anthropi]|uniref:hypothetical protein n=1 Tax=Brucella anthropi TaxID=529 RepID=UPI00124C4619|nr:hypothetical protein [Brucella anthropi]KAB2784144.1 hypothetical protein F9K97_18895 [Brucella anthropi]KAB2793146.1 hypothetical protein F9K87_21070 [Brucella anthropi]
MKNPIRNVVVEYKNKRTRKGSSSLWGNLDLKSIAEQVEADAPQSPMEVRVQPDLPKPIERRTENATTKVVSQTEPVIEQVEEALSKPELSNMDASKPEEAPLAMEEQQTANMVADAIARKKKPSVRRRMKKSAPQKQETVNRVVAEPDIQAELSALEIENADLKCELAARLRMENRQLHKMLRRLEQQ